MNLPEALRKQKEGFLEKAPADIVSVMNEAKENLSNSGILQECLQKGEHAPDFTLEDGFNNKINLQEELAKGPVILKFFRGDW